MTDSKQDKYTSNFSDYLIFADESGDDNLNSIDKKYPIFALAFVMIHKQEYINNLLPKIQSLKYELWGHEQVVFHENDIRKTNKEFAFLRTDKELREYFYNKLINIIDEINFKIISCIIDKNKFKASRSPYEVATYFCINKIYNFLIDNQQNNTTVFINFESRDLLKDNSLHHEIKNFMLNNNYVAYDDNLQQLDFSQINFKYQWIEKKCNSIGLQLADLIARPLGINFLNPQQENRVFSIMKTKILSCKLIA